MAEHCSSSCCIDLLCQLPVYHRPFVGIRYTLLHRNEARWISDGLAFGFVVLHWWSVGAAGQLWMTVGFVVWRGLCLSYDRSPLHHDAAGRINHDSALLLIVFHRCSVPIAPISSLICWSSLYTAGTTTKLSDIPHTSSTHDEPAT